MPTRAQRLTRRTAVALTQPARRRLDRFVVEAGLEEGEALSFLLENLDRLVDDARMMHRLRAHRTMLERQGVIAPAETTED